MPQTHPTAVIEGLYLASDPGDFYTTPVSALNFEIDPNGIVGNARHSGNSTLADIRAPSYFKKKDTVLNRQSVSFVSSEDLDYIATELALDPDVLTVRHGHGCEDTPEHITRTFLAQCLGANVLLGSFSATENIATFRELLPGTDFGPYDRASKKFTDATVMIARPNAPCMPPGKRIQSEYPLEIPDMAQRFVRAAQGRRGFVGMVAKPGKMSVGQLVGFVPLGMK